MAEEPSPETIVSRDEGPHMIINRRCDVCGVRYGAQRASSRFCGDVCRKRASRGAPGRQRVRRPIRRQVAKAVAKITDDLDVLLAFYDYPAEHWIHLRTGRLSRVRPLEVATGSVMR